MIRSRRIPLLMAFSMAASLATVAPSAAAMFSLGSGPPIVSGSTLE